MHPIIILVIVDLANDSIESRECRLVMTSLNTS